MADMIGLDICTGPGGCGHPRSEHKSTDAKSTTCLHGWTIAAKSYGITGCACNRFKESPEMARRARERKTS